MINKIISTSLDSHVKQCSNRVINRKSLKAVAAGTLTVLAGASMSNWSGPRLEPTEMVIPNGLDFKEKLYYNLKGRLPKSVYDRWFAKTEDSVIGQNDEIVTVNTDGYYVGSIVEGPHEAVLSGNVADTFSHGDGSSAVPDDITEMVSPDTESAMSMFEIFKHLAGLQ